MNITYIPAPLIISEFVGLKQAACLVMFYFYKHITAKHAKYRYVTCNVQDILTYST